MNPIWSALPLHRKISRIGLIVQFSIGFGLFFVGALFLLICLFVPSATDMEDILISVICFVLGSFMLAISFLWWKVEICEYKLKYYFARRKFRTLFADAAAPFVPFPEEYKLLRKECRVCYSQTGKLFDEGESHWLFRDKEGKAELKNIVTALVASIDDGSGFVGFFRLADEEKIKRAKPLNPEGTDDYLSGWSLFSYCSSPVFAGGFRFLAGRVMKLTEFTLYDNGLSAAYTEKNAEHIKKLDEVYSGILASYRTDLKKILEKL